MVPRGLEPRTLRLLALRSNQLSYETHSAHVAVVKCAQRCFPNATKNLSILRARQERLQEKNLILVGLEPTIPGSVGRCLIHWATGPTDAHDVTKSSTSSCSCAQHTSAKVVAHANTCLSPSQPTVSAEANKVIRPPGIEPGTI